MLYVFRCMFASTDIQQHFIMQKISKWFVIFTGRCVFYCKNTILRAVFKTWSTEFCFRAYHCLFYVLYKMDYRKTLYFLCLFNILLQKYLKWLRSAKCIKEEKNSPIQYQFLENWTTTMRLILLGLFALASAKPNGNSKYIPTF